MAKTPSVKSVGQGRQGGANNPLQNVVIPQGYRLIRDDSGQEPCLRALYKNYLKPAIQQLLEMATKAPVRPPYRSHLTQFVNLFKHVLFGSRPGQVLSVSFDEEEALNASIVEMETEYSAADMHTMHSLEKNFTENLQALCKGCNKRGFADANSFEKTIATLLLELVTDFFRTWGTGNPVEFHEIKVAWIDKLNRQLSLIPVTRKHVVEMA